MVCFSVDREPLESEGLLFSKNMLGIMSLRLGIGIFYIWKFITKRRMVLNRNDSWYV